MDSLALEVSERQKGLRSKVLRSTGMIPAIYYGKGQNNLMLQVPYQIFRKVFSKAGESTIIELNVNGKKIPVLVHEVQYDPISDEISHVDFIHVNMDKEVTTSVKVVILGIAPAVKNMGGILDIQKHEIRIKCLPKDLVRSIEVDVTPIVDFHTSIHVEDLKVPSTIKVLDNPKDTVVTATPPRAEEVTKPAEAAAVPAEGAATTGTGVAPGSPIAPTPAAPAAVAPAPGKK